MRALTVALAMAALAISAAAKPVSLYAAGGPRGALSTWRISLVAVVLITLLAPASAAEEGGRDKFAWPLERERAWFAAKEKPVVTAGQTLATIPNSALISRLQPGALAAFAMPPERKPKSERWFGGMIRFPAPDRPGIYQVTLSDEAWIDVVQDNRYARALGSTGRSDCPGLRKSLRLELAASPFVLQLSGVSSDRSSLRSVRWSSGSGNVHPAVE